MKMYLYYYPLVSLMLTIIYYLKVQSLSIHKDPIESLRELNESIEAIKRINKSVGEFLERIINSALEGDKLVAFIFVYTMFLVPIMRWLLIISVLKEKRD